MDLLFTIAWVAWALLALAAEFRWPSALMPTIFAFVIIEAAAVWRSTAGDTLSEMIWMFLDGGWSRAFFVLGGVAWVGLKLLYHGSTGPRILGAPVDRICLIGGFVIWAVIHLLFFGEYGFM